MGEMRIFGFSSRQTKFLTGDMSRQASELVRVGIGWSDCRHETDSSFRTTPKVPPRAIRRNTWVDKSWTDGFSVVAKYFVPKLK